MKNILISIVDDFQQFSSILARSINSAEGIKVAFIANNGLDFFTKLAKAKEHPDIVLMDLSMPIMNGMDAAKMLKATYPDIKVIIMTNHDDGAFVIDMIENGTEGYLFKTDHITKIIEAIHSVYSGNKHYSIEAIAKASSCYYRQNQDNSTIMNTLFNISSRELEVLKLICKAKNTKEISNELSISERTVETHRRSLLIKTGTKNAVDLAIMALYHKVTKIDRSDYMDDPYSKLNV